ncbi:signal peptidase I [bacterium]|nr:signal peptidase I [bacterium]
MSHHKTDKNEESRPQTPMEKTIDFIKLIVSTLIAVFLIRTFIISTYQIPTASMEDTLLTGDHIIANKFVYGVRSPDWIGIPYTKIGFHTPFFRIPGFRNPKPGDIVIFKYPEDTRDSYVKRCIAGSGDTVEVRNKEVYVNGKRFRDAPDGKFIDWQIYPENGQQYNIFPPGSGNRDNYGPVRVPAVGDTFHFSNLNKQTWYERWTIMLYEGHKIEAVRNGKRKTLDLENRRLWPDWIRAYSVNMFEVDAVPMKDYVHRIHMEHYFMMGDNRDNSLDSRYWGFVPRRYVLGEPIIIYWSWNRYLPWSKIMKKVRWNRFLRLVH